MKYACGFSLKKEAGEAAYDLKKQLENVNDGLVVFFASSKYEPETLAARMAEAFKPVPTIGCTTAGEIVSGQMLSESVVAMALDKEVVGDVSVELVEDLGEKVRDSVQGAFDRFEKHFGEAPAQMSHEKYLGLVMVDGLSMGEESLMDAIGDKTNVLFVGGSAGDDLAFQRTHVFKEGMARNNAAVLVLMKPGAEFGVLKTQSFRDTGKKLTVTSADEAKRTALELNGRPAIEAYAKAVGCSVEEAPDYFMRMPVGLMIQGEPFVRSPQQAQQGKMVFYCEIKEGMELALLESKDIVEDTQRDMQDKFSSWGKPGAILNFHCILRTLELKPKGQLESYGKLFSDIPTIGFSTYGEQYLGHINQTSTMVLFK